MWPRFIRIAYK